MTDLETRVETALKQIADQALTDDGTWTVKHRTDAALDLDPPGRRWGLWAAAAAVVVGGGVATAVALQRPAPDNVLTTPASSPVAPSSSPATATSLVTAAPASTSVVTSAAPPAEMERPVWMLDPAVAGSPPLTPLRLQQWILDDPMHDERGAVRVRADGSYDAVTWEVRPSPPGDPTSLVHPPVDLLTGVDVRRWQVDPAAIYYFPPADGLQLSVTVPLDVESELTPWLQTVAPSGIDVDAVVAPPGFEVQPEPIDSYALNYAGPRPGPGPVAPDGSSPLIVGVSTARYDAPFDIDTTYASPGYPPPDGWEAVEPPFGIGQARRHTPVEPDGPNSYSAAGLVWQPDPLTLVTLSAPRDWIDELAAGLVEVEASEVNATEADPFWRGGAPLEYHRVIQGETPLGRFSYAAYTDAEGNVCRILLGVGGGGMCANDAEWNLPRSAVCVAMPGGYYTRGELGTVRQTAVLVDADQVDFVEIRETPDSEPVEPNVVFGETDGHRWALVWAVFHRDQSMSNTYGLVKFSGGTCAAPSSYRPGTMELAP